MEDPGHQPLIRMPNPEHQPEELGSKTKHQSDGETEGKKQKKLEL